MLDAVAHPKRADLEFVDPEALDVTRFEGKLLHGETADGERTHGQCTDADDGESGGDPREGDLRVGRG